MRTPGSSGDAFGDARGQIAVPARTAVFARLGNLVSKNKLLLLLRLTITVLALFFLFRLYRPEDVADMVRGVGPAAFFAATALYVLCIFVGAWKWSIVLDTVPYATLLRAVLASCFYSILPSGQLGGELSKILIVKSRHPDVRDAVASVLFDKLTGVLGLLLLGAASLCLSYGDVSSWQIYMVSALAIGCMGFLLLAPLLAGVVDAIRLRNSLLRRAQGILGDALKKINQFARNRPLLLKSLLLGVLSQGTIVASYLVVASALDIRIEVTNLVSAVVLANLAALLPVSIGGFGVREAGLTALLANDHGVPGEQALALSLTVMSVFLLAAMAGGLVELRKLVTSRTLG